MDDSATSTLSYGTERELYFKEDCFDREGGKSVIQTTYVGAYEKWQRSGHEGALTEHKYHLGDITLTLRSSGQHDTYYQHKDHQGSVLSTTDKDGTVVSQSIYDPFGKRNEVYQASYLKDYTTMPTSEAGYTGHKMMDAVGIIHMKGRIYDPTLGRFLQADPHIQAPLNFQNYNQTYISTALGGGLGIG